MLQIDLESYGLVLGVSTFDTEYLPDAATAFFTSSMSHFWSALTRKRASLVLMSARTEPGSTHGRALIAFLTALVQAMPQVIPSTVKT